MGPIEKINCKILSRTHTNGYTNFRTIMVYYSL